MNVVTYEEFRKDYPIVPAKNCENCKYWKANESNFKIRVVHKEYEEKYKEISKIYDKGIWIGNCIHVSRNFKYPETLDQNDIESLMKYHDENISQFKKGCNYIGMCDYSMDTINTFCCEDIGQDLFEAKES